MTVSEMANEMHCSVSSLYKIASNKDELVVLAIARWGELSLADMEGRSEKGNYIFLFYTIFFSTSLFLFVENGNSKKLKTVHQGGWT